MQNSMHTRLAHHFYVVRCSVQEMEGAHHFYVPIFSSSNLPDVYGKNLPRWEVFSREEVKAVNKANTLGLPPMYLYEYMEGRISHIICVVCQWTQLSIKCI